MLHTLSGNEAVVHAKSLTQEAQWVFNFEVAHTHNYFVVPAEGEGVLVHNGGNCGGGGGSGSSGGQCFVAGTQVIGGTTEFAIETVEPGDVVLASAVLDDTPRQWVEVAPPLIEPKRKTVAGRVVATVSAWGRKLMLPAMLAAAPTVDVPELSDRAVVQRFDQRTGNWHTSVAGDLEVGDELLFEGHLLQVTPDGLDHRGVVTPQELAQSDATFDAESEPELPNEEDWVLVLDGGLDAGHWRLADVSPGDRFAYAGRVYDLKRDAEGMAIRPTGDVLGRVVETFVRVAPEVIDAQIRYADGSLDEITGTPEHPFWASRGGSEGT